MTGSVYSVRVKGLRWGAVGIRRREAPEPTAPHLLANVTYGGVRGWLVELSSCSTRVDTLWPGGSLS